MTIFDLIFLAGVLASAITLIAGAIAALRGRGAKAARVLLGWGVCVALYVATSLGVAYLRPQRIRATSEPWCFDDWCLQVQKVDSAPAGPKLDYRVELRVFSTARRVTQRAKGAWIYLFDERHRLYAPNPDPSATPLDAALAPLESIETSRAFEVPADVQTLGLITGHPGPYCSAFNVLFIGQATCLFDRPEMIRIK
jgi:hypothetical protein